MSTIVALGGTGYAGQAIVREAAQRGHQVIAFRRSAPSEPVAGVEYQQGDATNVAEIEPLIAGAAVVIAALAPHGEMAGKLGDEYAHLAQAAAQAGARFFVVGGFTTLRPAPDAPRFVEGPDVPPQFAARHQEMAAIHEWLEQHAPDTLDWLYICPADEFGAHAPGEPLGTYRTGGGVALFDDQGKSVMSGADFALAIVDEIDHPKHHRTIISFAY